jgi:hypothetical protein
MLAVIVFLLIVAAFLCFVAAATGRFSTRRDLVAAGLACGTLAILIAGIGGDLSIKGFDL